jgi:glycogenin glucosyltransferase
MKGELLDMKQCYVTYLGSNDYLIGTISLYLSLISVCGDSLLVMTSPKVGEKEKSILRNLSIPYMDVQVPDIPKQIQEFNSSHGFPHWNQTFAKLSMFDLADYDKIIFLDSDMMVLQNIDHLFSKKNFSAVASGRAYPGHEDWVQLNSGLIIIEPKVGLTKQLISKIPATVSNVIGDQDILHAYQPNWPKKKELHLSEGYNLFIDCVDYYLSHGILCEDDIYVIHFEGIKPWKRSRMSSIKYITKLILKMKWRQIKYFMKYQQYIDKSKKIIDNGESY